MESGSESGSQPGSQPGREHGDLYFIVTAWPRYAKDPKGFRNLLGKVSAAIEGDTGYVPCFVLDGYP